MLSHSMLRSALVLGVLGSSVEAQQAALPAQPERTGRTYKVALWFEMDRPISSLKFQAYDLAKGEYDQKAIDRWLDAIRAGHLKSGAYIREIRTDGVPGATEAERLASAIELEKQRWAHLQGQGQVSNLLQGSSCRNNATRSPSLTGPRVGFDRPSPGSPGGLSNPPTSPIPSPYRSRPL